MTRNDLYDVAFRYKKAGLWKKLWDNDAFAVKLKSGEIGHISIMGQNGEYNALGLYIGEEGFGSYRIMANAGGPTGSPFKDHELLLQQNCLQAALEIKEDLMPEEVEEVRSYAKVNGILDQMTEVIDAILSMSRQELKMIPKPLLKELRMMMEHDIFPKDVAAELRAKLKGID